MRSRHTCVSGARVAPLSLRSVVYNYSGVYVLLGNTIEVVLCNVIQAPSFRLATRSYSGVRSTIRPQYAWYDKF